jgi:probable phosphoglycerate mutase
MIYLLRHGQTEFNRDGRYQGQSDSPLTDLGRRQAMAFGALLAAPVPDARIRSSPLGRAVSTARLIAQTLPGARVTLDDRLRELSMGHCDGLTRAEIAARWPDLRRGHPPRQWMFHTPGGERLGDVTARLSSALADVAATEGDVILVSHAVTGRLLRGLHAGLALPEALQLDAPQDVVYRLLPDGRVDTLPRTGL